MEFSNEDKEIGRKLFLGDCQLIKSCESINTLPSQNNSEVEFFGRSNVGKSSLLAAVSMAKPKIADYEFTTIHPNLGVVLVSEYEKFVVAYIPGLIKGASQGKGLGIQFLKHISRTKLLLNVIDISNKKIECVLNDIKTI